MLTETHLAVIRAALKYWDDEMVPGTQQWVMYYLSPQDQHLTISDSDVTSARKLLSKIELSYALMDKHSGLLMSDSLVAANNGHELSYQADRAVIVSVLRSRD